MTIATDFSPTGLVRPPVQKAAPDQPIPGQLPPAGAGSGAPLNPTAVGDPSVGALPFGNGVTPAGFSGTDLTMYGGSPVNTVSAPPTGVAINPQVTPPTPAASGDLQNSIISPTGSGAIDAGPNVTAPNTFGSDVNAPSTFGSNPVSSYSGSASDPRLSSAQSMLDASAQGLNGIDRTSMLNKLLSNFDTQQNEADNNAYRASAGFSAAAGRIGSGAAAQDINQITRQSMGDRNRYRSRLAADTIDKQIGDQFSKTSLFSGLANDAFGQNDRNRNFGYGVSQDQLAQSNNNRNFNYGVNQDYIGQQNNNRNFNYGVNRDSVAQGNTNRNFNYGVNSDNYNRSAQNRAELRGERTYQNNQAQQGFDNANTSLETQNRLTNSAFDRNAQRYQYGNANNPSGVYGQAANGLQGQSDQTTQMLMRYLQSLGTGQ